MNTIRIALLASAGLLVATAAMAQAATRATPEMNEVTRAPFIPPLAPASPSQSRPLFTVGDFGVYLWAPVPPPYDANNDRNFAADPVWGD